MALSVKQPYASAILWGRKRVENRDWFIKDLLIREGSPPAEGRWLMLHSSVTPAGKDEVCKQLLLQAYPSMPCDNQLLKGFILGWMYVHCIVPFPASVEHASILGDDPQAVGPFCWVITRTLPLEKPVRWQGKLHLWQVPAAAEVPVPEEVRVALDACAAPQRRTGRKASSDGRVPTGATGAHGGQGTPRADRSHGCPAPASAAVTPQDRTNQAEAGSTSTAEPTAPPRTSAVAGGTLRAALVDEDDDALARPGESSPQLFLSGGESDCDFGWGELLRAPKPVPPAGFKLIERVFFFLHRLSNESTAATQHPLDRAQVCVHLKDFYTTEPALKEACQQKGELCVKVYAAALPEGWMDRPNEVKFGVEVDAPRRR